MERKLHSKKTKKENRKNKLKELLIEAYKYEARSRIIYLTTYKDKITLSKKEIINKYYYIVCCYVFTWGCYEPFSFKASIKNSYKEELVFNYYKEHRRKTSFIEIQSIVTKNIFL